MKPFSSRLGLSIVLAMLLPLITACGTVGTQAQAPEPTKVVLHVDDNDPARMNMALNNASNVNAHYQAQGQDVIIEVVAYGPGLHMLRADTSPVAGRIDSMALELPNISFSACGNTLNGMAKKEGKEPELLQSANVVPSGVVRLMELQESGYSYIRP